MTQRESNPFPYSEDNKRYLTYSYYLKRRFGQKVFKVPLNIDLGCPNRDGTLGYGGCIFCSEGGSGDFAESRALSVTEQIESGKEKVKNKIKSGKYKTVFTSKAMRTMLGIGPKVHLVAPKSIVRSEGKAVRVIDNRKLHD